MPARSIEQIRNLCKRRGFIFPGSAAYGGLGSFWDYGPLGVEMLNHIKRAWWRSTVYERDDMEGLDSAIITSRKVWQHSGHEATFSDPLVDCKKCRTRHRADHLTSNVCPKCGAADLTEPRRFNLMFQSHVGPVEASPGTEEELASRVYLRPETAQGIFMNFKHVQNSLRRKVPFGVAQIGKAFRNEITPGNFIFRTREFEQMEIEFFIKPPQFVKDGDKTDEQWHEEWISQRYNWWLSLGIDPSRLRKRAQDKAELAHYAKATTDLEYLFPDFGWGEVEGIANRTDFDLSAHSRDVPEADLARLKLEKNSDSTETFDYFDPDAKARYIPWVIEPSAGVTRAMLAFLCEAYHEELVKEPTPAEVDPLKAEIDAVVKNAEKKKKEAEKEPDQTKRKHDPAAIAAFTAALAEMAGRLPQSLLEIDNLLEDHAGAQNLEPAKKLKPKIARLAEDCVRVVLRLHPALAPVKVAIFPLKKNEPAIVDIGQRITRQLAPFMRVQYDDSAGIGRLYRRQDEIGTPFCITVDFQTLEDNTVTLRERDSMQQTRVNIADLKHLLMQRLHLA
ncbi:MAG: glycine--tRNA ligase [Planctomycetes bacterium]|nr:glycine--tRNA ligase [Planctomycetota bacterium]MCL4729743.1 glycine--tRNA ligase [Planctomycetota bacterium]